jgi:beta-lactamase class A
LQRRTGLIAWLVIGSAIAALFLAWQYLSFRLATRTMPAGMTMAGLSVEGMTREQALNRLDVAFATPLQITYLDQRLSLPLDSVELRLNTEETLANLDAALSKRRGLDGFIAHVLDRPLEPVDVPVAVSYSEDRLDGFLTRVARQYDRAPQELVPLPDNLTFRAGQPGQRLDVEASRARFAAALVSATDDSVELVVRTEQAPPRDVGVLYQMLELLLESHVGIIPGIFVKDLVTGDELQINAEVAYDGLDVLKIAILEETYRSLESPLTPEVANWVSATMGIDDDNINANLLLRDAVGRGDSYQGVEELTASMNNLGLSNTFMAAPYDQESPIAIVTAANSRSDITTGANPYAQTTPLDIGLLLEMMYQCSQGGGTLMVVFPDTITRDECHRMIEWMSIHRTDSLTEAGVPVGTKVAHKQGFSADTHADAALVYSTGGDFVLVVYLYRPQWLSWDESAPLITDIATATYNYFNPSP